MGDRGDAQHQQHAVSEAHVARAARFRADQPRRGRAEPARRQQRAAGEKREGARSPTRKRIRASSAFGSPGIGATAHLSMELFKTLTGTNMVHVPYKGSAGVLADVTGGPDPAHDGQHSGVPAAGAAPARSARSRCRRRSARRPRPRSRPSPKRACPVSKRCRGSGCSRPRRRRRPIVDKLSAETQRILKLPDVQRAHRRASARSRSAARRRSMRRSSRPRSRSGRR